MKINVHVPVNDVLLRLFKYCNYEVTGAGTNNTDVIYSVLMTSEMHNSYNQFYSTVFCMLHMFRKNLVVQFGTIGTIVQASLHDCTNCTM